MEASPFSQTRASVGFPASPVTVWFIPPSGATYEQAAAWNERLVNSLVTKYGFALISTKEKPLPENVQAVWNCPKALLMLKLNPWSDGKSKLSFIYSQQPKKDDANGL